MILLWRLLLFLMKSRIGIQGRLRCAIKCHTTEALTQSADLRKIREKIGFPKRCSAELKRAYVRTDRDVIYQQTESPRPTLV